ncbi:WD40 repeat domain-containing serine/threonine protein kinase [Nannocystis radixulma]|uniref:Serine/threonine-protein kinase n=1 Tax=Nannocystis radixulma TaxID=2995305 RepID=A0ABT5B4M0_9BACT|nr:serine/threonine-protein kinase [Nannocystis radixulma]MDC0669058.1 serine/threonine-protein kinase [Nannocystis radixulma]
MSREHPGSPTAPTLQIDSTGDPRCELPAQGSVARPGEPTFARGTLIDRYVLLEHVGAGAMGVVYGAYDPELDRKIALKFLKAQGRDDKGRARLLREAQAMARLAHPNVVTVHDVGTFGDEVFVAMEFVHGVSLRQWLHARRRSWRDIVAVFIAIGRGLAAAHGAGLVHRDLKPENVMIGVDERVRVMDFGLARASTGEPGDEPPTCPREQPLGLELTRTGTLMGTPAYMAPEQWEGREADARTDQFAYCVALWEALYGARPFRGETPSALLLAITRGQLTPPRDARRAPAWLRRVLERGLAVDPAARWPSMSVLLGELARDREAARRRLGALLLGVAALIAAALVARAIDDRRIAAERAREAQERASRAVQRESEVWRLTTIGARERDALELAVQVLAEYAPTYDRAPQAVIDGLVRALPAMLPVAELPTPADTPRAVELSDDGALLAVQLAGDDGVQLWSTDPVHHLGTIHTGAVQRASVSLSPDNRFLVVHHGDRCDVYATTDGRRTAQIRRCHDLAFARDGSQLFTLSAHSGPVANNPYALLFDAVNAWSPERGVRSWSTPLSTSGAALAVHPDGRHLVVATDRPTPTLLATDSGEPVRSPAWRGVPAWNRSWARPRRPDSLAVSPDGRFIAVAHPSAAEDSLVFDMQTRRVERLPHRARSVLFSVDGRRLLTANNAAENTVVFRVPVGAGGEWEQARQIVGELHEATASDELLVVGAELSLSSTPNLRQGTPPISNWHTDHMSASRGSTRFAILSSRVTLWDSADRLELRRWTPPRGEKVMRFDEREVSTRDDAGVIRLHDRRGTRPPLVLAEPDAPGDRSHAWSVAGGVWRETVAGARDGGLIRFHDENSGRERYRRQTLGGGRQTAAPAARAALIAGAVADGSVEVLAPPDPAPLCRFPGDGTRVREVRISGDGAWVGVLRNSGELSIWSTASCERHLSASPFRMPDQLATGILSFLGSELLVVRGDDRTSVLDPSTGHERLLAVDNCDDHSSPQGFSIISSDGRYLLTSCRSRGHLGDVSLWAVDSGVKLAEHDFSAYSGVAYNSMVRSPGMEDAPLLEFAHSGDFLVARTQKGQLAVLSVPEMREEFRLHTRSRADDLRLHGDDREIDVLDAESGVIHTYPVTRAGLVEAACAALEPMDSSLATRLACASSRWAARR